MRVSLIAAGLALLAAVVVVTGSRASTSAPVRHTCSATDRDFLQTARTNMAALGAWGEQFGSGDATASEVIAEARAAARRVEGTAPTDPSLARTRTLLAAMFNEYGRAIHAKSKNRDAGTHMYRAYGLANFAHDVLIDAAPELRKRGCDVTTLL